MDLWPALFDVLTLLLAALVLGAICERLRQSAIIGYLLAGTLLGPNALHLITSEAQVDALAELGVAILLFTIGLEFSWRRLRQMGAAALGGGAMQIVITTLVAAAVAIVLGQAARPAIAIGAIIAMSSTACVLRILVARAQVDSVHGRHALGFLLMQDLAVVPLVLLVSLLGGEGSVGDMAFAVGKTVVFALLLIGGFYILFNYVIPPLLATHSMRRNRELPTLLAIVMGLGSSWLAHRLSLSPALGAFVAGILLAESPFATPVRAVVTSLRTALMTLFFSSIGMLADPLWIAQHWFAVTTLVVAIVVGKSLIIWPLLRYFGQTHASALATGICLAQVGEFSFLLAAAAHGRLLSDDLFLLIISATIVTLLVTPYLVITAPHTASGIVHALARLRLLRGPTADLATPDQPPIRQIVIVGFGPAGQAVGYAIVDRKQAVAVVDLNRQAIAMAQRLGFRGYVADATHADVLEHLHVATAAVVVVTIPDPAAARRVIQHVRAIAPMARILVRSRYHVYRWELELAGAHAVIDEEEHVGLRLAEALHQCIQTADKTQSQPAADE